MPALTGSARSNLNRRGLRRPRLCWLLLRRNNQHFLAAKSQLFRAKTWRIQETVFIEYQTVSWRIQETVFIEYQTVASAFLPNRIGFRIIKLEKFKGCFLS